jgi:hypothetical protein
MRYPREELATLRREHICARREGRNVMEYAVKAEIRDGEITILKRGFVSYEAAEDHPVKMSDWRRVWIEAIDSSNPDIDRS